MPWRFQTSRDRINRAHAHCEEIGKLWKALIAGHTHDAILHVNDDGAGFLRVEPAYDHCIMEQISLFLGEALYQFMAALDACIYQAAVIDSGQDPPPGKDHLYFPICSTPEYFKNARRKIAPLAQKRRDIVESIQPYNAPKLPDHLLPFNYNRSLFILGEWARIDRHRKLHVVGTWGSNASPMFILPAGTELRSVVLRGSGFLEEESEIASFKILGFVPGMKVQANPNLTIDIAINEVPPPCSDSDRLATRLLAIEKAVRGVVGAFEESF